MAFVAPIIAGGMSIMGGMAATGIVKGLMIAGGALTMIGGITGNQKLMKIGGIASLAGGIGGLASGAFSSGAGAAAKTATGTTGAAATGGSIADMIAAPVGSQAFMQGTGAAIGSNLTGTGLNTLASSAGPMAGSGVSGLLGSAMGGAGSAAAAGGGVMSSLGRVGGFIKDNAEVMKIGGDMLSGAMNRKAQMSDNELTRAHQLAMQKNDKNMALEIEEEMRRRKSDSITGLKPMSQTVSGNPEGQAVTTGFQSTTRPGGLVARQWQGAFA